MGTDFSRPGTVPTARRHSWSLAAYLHMARKRLGGQADIDIKQAADKAWDIAPGEVTVSPPAVFLPGQLERITGWEGKRFYPYVHPGPTMQGGIRMEQGPTRGYLVRNAWLIDGALYKGNASHWLSLKPQRFPPVKIENEIERGAIYCTQNGNAWFGTWLMEDCPTYALACDEGVPVTTAPSSRYPLFTQGPAYEDWLGMHPLRLRTAFFHELVLFDDMSNNRNRYQRYRDMGHKLLAHVEHAPHPGVFILRGSDGDLRLLRNELELAPAGDPGLSRHQPDEARCAGDRRRLRRRTGGHGRGGQPTGARGQRAAARGRGVRLAAAEPFRQLLQVPDRPRRATVRVCGGHP